MNEDILKLMGQFKTIVHDGLSLEMKAYAKDNGVPIIEEQGLELLLQLLRIKNPVDILEIGSAIGYSSLMMARHLPGVFVTTIERDEATYEKATGFLKGSAVGGQIALIKGDALEIDLAKLPKEAYDVIFIDAAKAQYQKFFEKYEPILKEDGIIISDNLLFHGLVLEQDGIASKNLRKLVQKISLYNEWLASHPHYDTLLLPIGDGIAISKKKAGVKI
ncbi:MAG: O-methyltransferase [Turicibacter sp.]|nr:O-methyltransferase [Turicibacter sp.]